MEYLETKFEAFWQSVGKHRFAADDHDKLKAACFHWYSMGLRHDAKSAEALDYLSIMERGRFL